MLDNVNYTASFLHSMRPIARLESKAYLCTLRRTIRKRGGILMSHNTAKLNPTF